MEPGTVNPLAVATLAEVGVNIVDHVAEGIEAYVGAMDFDHVIIVCDRAAESCPADWPGAGERLHWFFEDPSAATGTVEERLAVFRRVRDRIDERIREWTSSSADG